MKQHCILEGQNLNHGAFKFKLKSCAAVDLQINQNRAGEVCKTMQQHETTLHTSRTKLEQWAFKFKFKLKSCAAEDLLLYSRPEMLYISTLWWIARAGEDDTGDILKFVINLLPLNDFSRLIPDIWRVVTVVSRFLMQEPRSAMGYVGWWWGCAWLWLWIPHASLFSSVDFGEIEILTEVLWAKRSNEVEWTLIACQEAVHWIEQSQMQVTQSFINLMFLFVLILLLTGMLTWEVFHSNLFIFAAHIIYMRISGPQ